MQHYRIWCENRLAKNQALAAHRLAQRAKPDLAILAHDYRTKEFPRLFFLRDGSWSLVVSGYKPILADSPTSALALFRQRYQRPLVESTQPE